MKNKPKIHIKIYSVSSYEKETGKLKLLAKVDQIAAGKIIEFIGSLKNR